MNAHLFDSRSTQCPFCHRLSRGKQGEVLSGLMVCPHCQERLVVSWSGHYVRDPFTLKRVETEHMLRRQSQPLARFVRDFGIVKPLSVLTLLGSFVCISLALVNVNGVADSRDILQPLLSPKPSRVSPPPSN
jgi:hypothetical protein